MRDNLGPPVQEYEVGAGCDDGRRVDGGEPCAEGTTIADAPKLKADRDQIQGFVEALFRYCNGGYILLRSFYHDPGRPPADVRSVEARFHDEGMEPLIRVATARATFAAGRAEPTVFAPPIATFKLKKGAREEDLHEGPVLSVECDANPQDALRRMEALLGPATVVVRSGGQWSNPETGEVEDKLHLHWRLTEPTQELGDHTKLKRARRLAAVLAGSDKTAVPVVHPMRWPGSWHRKGEPKLCRIADLRGDAEIDLDDALEKLEEAAVLAGYDAPAEGRKPALGATLAHDDDLAAYGDTIANTENTDWETWNRIGMAFYAASGGGEAGLAAFDQFSSKRADIYDGAVVVARWEHFHTSPPTKLSAGTLVYEARKSNPDFRPPSRDKPGGTFGGRWERWEAVAPGEFDAPEPPATTDWEVRLERAIAEVNETHFIVRFGSRLDIATKVFEGGLGRRKLIFMRPQELKTKFLNRRYKVGYTQKENEIWKDLGTAWLEHRDRREYDRIELIAKGDCPGDVYNLWSGFGVTPVAGEWSTIRRHLVEVACGGDEAHVSWLINWMAYCVQHPDKQAEVAVVLRGLKGTGKGWVSKIMMRIFRDHALHITNQKHLVGNFNSHLMSTLFLFLDEAVWAGDKSGEGVLKGLITEDRVIIEPKGVDSFQVPNRLKVLMATNANWAVPASEDERRFFFLDVSDCRKGDTAYFKALAAAIDGPELAAMLHALLAVDLSEWDHRNPPHTPGLNDQKLLSADSVTRYWYDCLSTGTIVGNCGGGGSSGWPAGSDTHADGWPTEINTKDLYARYVRHAHDHGERYPATINRLGIRLRELFPGNQIRQHRPRAGDGGARPRTYLLHALEEHRTSFLEAMNIDPDDHEWIGGGSGQ